VTAAAAADVGSAPLFRSRTLILGIPAIPSATVSPTCKAHPATNAAPRWTTHGWKEDGTMLRWFQRPKLEASFTATHALSDEFARTIEVAGDLTIRNDGSDTDLHDIEMIVIAGFRRIPLEVPGEWRARPVASGAAAAGAVRWSLTLDAPPALYATVRC